MTHGSVTDADKHGAREHTALRDRHKRIVSASNVVYDCNDRESKELVPRSRAI